MKGSRLRLVVGVPTSPFFQRNRYSGKSPSLKTAADARVAHIKFLHGGDQLSSLEIPLGR